MKAYLKFREDKSKYIRDVINNGETLTVVFADKKVHNDIENTDENFKALEDKLEEQMADALKREPIYALRTVLAAGLVVAAETGACVLTQYESIQQHPNALLLTGAAFVAAGVPTIINFLRENSRVKELSKVRYRNRHFERLQKVGEYNHAFDGSRRSIVRLFEEEENPLSIFNLDSYRKKDLKNIIREMDREDAMNNDVGVTYVKTK